MAKYRITTENGTYEITTEDEPSSQGKSSLLDDVGDTLKQYFNNMNPATGAQGLAQAAGHPIDAVKSYGEQNQHLLDSAKDAFHKGNYSEGVRHSLSYLLNGIPGVGAMLDQAGTKAGTGDYKGAIADTAALASQIALGKVGPKAVAAAAEPGVLPTAGDVAASAKAAVKAGGSDVVKGAGTMAVGGAIEEGSRAIGIPPGVAYGAGVAPAYVGARQVGRGVRKGWNAGVQTMSDRMSPPEVSVTPPARIAADLAASPTQPTPYFAQGSTLDPSATVAPARTAADLANGPARQLDSQMAGQPVPAEPAAAPSHYDKMGDDLRAKMTSAAKAKDEAIADWATHPDRALTAEHIEAMNAQEFADLQKKVNPKYRPRINDPEFLARKQDVADLLRTRAEAAKTAQTAAELHAKGIRADSIEHMSDEELGLPPGTGAKRASDLIFQLRRLEQAVKAPIARAN